jgi:hypothetical protein
MTRLLIPAFTEEGLLYQFESGFAMSAFGFDRSGARCPVALAPQIAGSQIHPRSVFTRAA